MVTKLPKKQEESFHLPGERHQLQEEAGDIEKWGLEVHCFDDFWDFEKDKLEEKLNCCQPREGSESWNEMEIRRF